MPFSYIFFVSLFFSSLANAQVVRKVLVQGNQYIESPAILRKMSTRVGRNLDPAKVAVDIKRIYSLGYFSEIQFLKNGSTVIVKVKERPRIMDIRFTGSNEFSDEDLLEFSGLAVNKIYNTSEVSKAKEIIQNKFSEKGYYLSDVSVETKPFKNTQDIVIEFNLESRQKVKIRKVIFTGNKNISSRILKRVMRTSEGHLLSPLTGSGLYQEQVFERDIQTLGFYYANEGFIKAKVAKPRVVLSQDKRYIDVMISIDEGKKHRLGDVTYTGDSSAFDSLKLQEAFGLNRKDVFSMGKMQQGLRSLSDLFGDKGHAYVNVVPKMDAANDSEVVDLVINVDKGPIVKWGKITIVGNLKTHDKVIRRELSFAEGDVFSATGRRKSFESVRRLGYFGESVSFVPSSPKGRNDIMDLKIEIEEKPTGNVGLNAGYGSKSSWAFGGKLSQENLFGRGWGLNFNANINNETQTFNLNFTEPRVFDTKWLASINAFISEDQVGYQPPIYDIKKIGVNFTIGKELFDNFTVAAKYRLDHTKIKDPLNPNDASATPNPGLFTDASEDVDYITSSLTTRFSLDTRDNRLNPTKGWFWSNSFEYAGLGGRDFQAVNTNLRFYYPLFWGIVLKSRLAAGIVTNFVNDDPIPDAERFRMGGVSSLRGYDPASIGVSRSVINLRDGGTTPEDFVIGGETKFLTNLEFEFTLIPDANIKGVVFFDAGSAADKFFARINGNPALLSNYGWGIRWYSPMGPLRFEWGFPLSETSRNPTKDTRFNFVISPTF